MSAPTLACTDPTVDETTPSANPLGEVFGYTPTATGDAARNARDTRTCPFKDGGACRKVSRDDPLGVCTVVANPDDVADGQARQLQAICPHRFRQDGIVFDRIAELFFGEGVAYRVAEEVALHSVAGASKGKFDAVLVPQSDRSDLPSYVTVELQAVYVHGNIRAPFEAYMRDPGADGSVDWSSYTVRPDNRSAGPKRLIPQLREKGAHVASDGQTQAVVLDRCLWEFINAALPTLPRVDRSQADMIWLVVDFDDGGEQAQLRVADEVPTTYHAAMEALTRSEAADMEKFRRFLAAKT